MNEKRLMQLFQNLEIKLLNLINEIKEKLMSQNTDMIDAVSKSVAQSELVIAAVLSQNQVIIKLNAVVAGTSPVDPALTAAMKSLNDETAKMHDVISGNSVIVGVVVFPTDDQVVAFAALSPAPSADQIARYKSNNLTNAEEVQFGIFPTEAQVIAFSALSQNPTADQIARFKVNNLTVAEKKQFSLV